MLIVPSLHPAAIARGAKEDGIGMAKFFDTVVDDFKKAKAFRTRNPEWDESKIWERDANGRYTRLFPTVQDVWNYCVRNRGKMNAVDVETTGEQAMDCRLLCIGMATADGDVINVPFLRQGGFAYWTPGDLQRVLELMRWFLWDPGTPKVMHNGPFDSVVLYTHGFDVFSAWIADTMQQHHVYDSELPHGLDYSSSRELEVPYWKGAVKGDIRWLDLPDEILRSYNLRDCLATARLEPIYRRKIQAVSPRLWECYLEEVELCKEMARATLCGIWMDPVRQKTLSDKYHLQSDESITALRAIVRDPGFNPASPAQLQRALFQTLGFPVVLKTSKGAPSTNKDAMVLLALHARSLEQLTFLNRLARWRKVSKALSTWIDGAKVLSDGRIHPSWKCLTVTGRFSSSPNAQNWGPEVKKIHGEDEEHDLVGVDLNQAELRMIGYAANDQDLLYMYEHGLNVHTINTTLLFGLHNPDKDTNAATEAYLTEMYPRLRDGAAYEDLKRPGASKWKSSRTLGKNFVFGDNYGAIAETLHKTIRAKRDPDTDEALFPSITLGQIEAAKVFWEQIHPAIPRYWARVTHQIESQGYYECPISGRRRWFRGGFKRNEMLNNPIQMGIASHMNKAMLVIARRLRTEVHPTAQIICQVHDMLGARTPRGLGGKAGRIMEEELGVPRAWPGFPKAFLPADKHAIGRYLNEV